MTPAEEPGTGKRAKGALRPPETVMRLSRMGASFPTRLSFMRSLIRRLNREKAQVRRAVWEMDENGYGHAVYSVDLGGDTYSLIAFSQALADADRSDRVIAEAWDAAFALYDGVPDAAEIARIGANVPKQEAGRYEASELSISRANKSVRFFGHVVDCLSHGRQPDPDLVASVGYLMRTTAVYGNGKFGFADRARIAQRPAMRGSFQVELLNVWLIRGFTLDLVEHVARARDPRKFVPLKHETRRALGIGNSTGLGMAPFLVNHPLLLNNWAVVRETALARVCDVARVDPAMIARITELMARVARHLEQWNVADARQMTRIEVLRREWPKVQAMATPEWLGGDRPWARLVAAGAPFSEECQELIVALVLEPHGDLIDDLAAGQASEPGPVLDPAMTLGFLAAIIAQNFDWAIAVDFTEPAATARFWYVSETKLEPRFGNRFDEDGADRESPLDIARQVRALASDLESCNGGQSVAEFLLGHPEHRHAARRIQASVAHPYSEIRDNLIAADCLPIDMLRFKLAQFGASKFDPKSELWTRINMYQGAPVFDDIDAEDADDWWLPVLEVN